MTTKTRTMSVVLGCAAVLGCGSNKAAGLGTPAGSTSFNLVAGPGGAANHWPGADGLVGTMDDTVNATLSPMNQSEANSIATYSYNAFDFGTGQTETGLLPMGMNAVTFLQGTIAADLKVAKSGVGSLITAWSLSGTQPFPGHGAYNAQITAVQSGTYNPGTHAFTMKIDISASLAKGAATASGINVAGQAFLVQSADFTTPTGNTYVDGVLVPLAKGMNATALLFAQASGTVPASSGGSGGSFPALPVRAVIVAVSTQ